MEQNLLNTLASGDVTRYHATPSVDSQTISQHSWGVTMIYTELCRLIDYTVDPSALLHALTHDCVELFTGDLPFTLKRDHPDFKVPLKIVEVSYEKQLLHAPAPEDSCHRVLLKLADYIEGMWWCHSHESRSSGTPVLENYAKGVVYNWEEAMANCFFTANEERCIEQFLSECLLKYRGEDMLGHGGPTPAYVDQ